MDYEKVYKEALERARKSHDKANGFIKKEWIETIFPELKESEDERIRKEMIDVFSKFEESYPLYGDTYDYKKWIAWLEKQAEPQPYKGNADTMRKNLIRAFKSVGSKHWGGFDVRDILSWLESKDSVKLEKQGEQKWSEEDEKIRTWCISHFKSCSNVAKDNDEYKNYLDNKIIKWLKSLKPQSHWKPTDEQLSVLYWIFTNIRLERNDEDVIESLYDDIEKL